MLNVDFLLHNELDNFSETEDSSDDSSSSSDDESAISVTSNEKITRI